jgi:hypothetical protein
MGLKIMFKNKCRHNTNKMADNDITQLMAIIFSRSFKTAQDFICKNILNSIKQHKKNQ